MLLLADFEVDSDLCFAEDAEPLSLNGPDNSFTLTLSNAANEKTKPGYILSAQLIFEVTALNLDSRDAAYDKFAEILNFLTYTTSRKFFATRLCRVIDWTPGLTIREAIIYAEIPVWDSAEPALNESYLKTAIKLLAAASGEEQRQAIRWYRVAIQERNQDQQFSLLWFALEIVAEATKEPVKVTSKCPVCREALFCGKCNKHPVHRPYPAEAIRILIQRVHPNDAATLFETLQQIRHTLMHGGRISSLESELPCTPAQAIRKLGWITWNAIFLMFKPLEFSDENEKIHFGQVDDLTHRTLVGEAHVRTMLLEGGDPNNPQLKYFPTFHTSITFAGGPAARCDGADRRRTGQPAV
jgi:hypothetical protein